MLAFGTQAEADIAAQQDTYPWNSVGYFEKIRQASCTAPRRYVGSWPAEIGFENLFATRRQNSGVLKLQRQLRV